MSIPAMEDQDKPLQFSLGTAVLLMFAAALVLAVNVYLSGFLLFITDLLLAQFVLVLIIIKAMRQMNKD
jgi:hypothetical protein